MKKFTKVIAALMLMVVIVVVGCKKPEDPSDPSNGGNGSGDDPTPTVPTEEGMYLGIIGFNEQLYQKDISLLNSSTKSSFKTFINGLSLADGTALYYADYIALNGLQSFPEPSALKKVALVTFTDGLDNLSTSSSTLNPENYNSISDYRDGLHNKILNDKVHGLPITAYTIGLRGNDVQNNLTEFRANLTMLASDANSVFEVTDMTEALERFRAIAEDLYYAVTTINLKMKLPGGFDDGLILRFTFDDVSDAESSQDYMQCVYKRTPDNGRCLECIEYHGFVNGVESMNAVSQTETGTFHWFEFEGLTHSNGDAISQYDINHIQLWKKQEAVWQRDSEFTPGSSTEVTETKSSAMIMLVLDCTSSLGGDFSMMKTGAVRFVETLCSSNGGGTHNYSINITANPVDGGTVSGGGTYEEGQSCTVSAMANAGYTFLNWTLNDNVVSSDATYTFTVTSNRNLVANFTCNPTCVVKVVASPLVGGMVNGGGTYELGQNCTVSAIANNGYTFTNWTENDSVVSSNANYAFTVINSLNLVAHFSAKPTFTIAISANPTSGGSVTGGGIYEEGQSCTVSATANEGYIFSNWTENGSEVSDSISYSFTVSNNRTLVANFTAIPHYNVVVSANPTNGGTVIGGGEYLEGQTCTVIAVVNNGYHFERWTEDGVEVATSYNYAFLVTNNRNLVANFTYVGSGNAPIGAINGLYTINSNDDQVYFSQGNLQYQASTQTWRFAENQYDYVGDETNGNVFENGVKCDNSNISSTYDGWIDLFGWGTSGWNCGNLFYHPWDYTVSDGTQHGSFGPPGNYDLTGSYAQSDWGVHNAISNGGNVVGRWRTLTQLEWDYVFNERHTLSGILYAKAQVADVNGVILLPDDWNNNYYTLENTNQNEASFSSNVISSYEWMNSLQAHGAIFFPTAGIRYKTNVNHVNDIGYYWSTSHTESSLYINAYYIRWTNTKIHIYDSSRNKGLSVRLVCPGN